MQKNTLPKTTFTETGKLNMSMQNTQRGGSGIQLIIILALLGYGVFVGLQYIPLRIESGTVQAVLDNLVNSHRQEGFSDLRDLQAAVDKQLYINEREDLKNSFEVTSNRGRYVVTVRYDRELNLLYTKKTISTNESITLD
jgi:hypothetical protein